jgi:preprotein translocase subunit SecA
MPWVWLGWHTVPLITRWRHQAFLRAVQQEFGLLEALSIEEIHHHTWSLRAQIQAKGLTSALVCKAFALVKVHCVRSMGVTPYDTQLMAARIMLSGQLAEMATGEGKTLTAGIGAGVAAFTGQPVHLLTSNDYLVSRDAEALTPLYSSLGFTVGTVLASMQAAQRKQAYACDVVYCTAKELVFDFMRDEAETQHFASALQLQAAKLSAAAPNTVLNALNIVFLDEADSLLIDEATVPLILSRYVSDDQQQRYFVQAMALTQPLEEGHDFILNRQHKQADLTPQGLEKVMLKSDVMGGVWHNAMYVRELIQTALAARYLYQASHEYLVSDNEIMVIDAITGRVAEGRVWSKGLHQMIALKEGLVPKPEVETIAQITYQRFFAQIPLVGGMSGTLHEARTELHAIYGLSIQQVPLFKPSQRQLLPIRVFKQAEEVWAYACQRIQFMHQLGRPVLIGTDSVADSELISQRLKQLGLPHQVLNARQNAIEASVIAAAGQLGRITVSTNMAGRGTDIRIAPEVVSLGGLHVLICQHNDSGRIDRQLIGRAARQGDPGSAEQLINLEKYSMYAGLLRSIGRFIPVQGRIQPACLVRLLVGWPKWLQSYHQRSHRRAIYQQDIELEEGNFSV